MSGQRWLSPVPELVPPSQVIVREPTRREAAKLPPHAGWTIVVGRADEAPVDLSVLEGIAALMHRLPRRSRPRVVVREGRALHVVQPLPLEFEPSPATTGDEPAQLLLLQAGQRGGKTAAAHAFVDSTPGAHLW